MSTRKIAVQCLLQVCQQKKSLTDVFNQIQIEAKELGLLKELCFGVLRYFYTLEFISKQLLNKPLKENDLDLTLNIYLGLYQLIYLRTPDHAAIFETVEICKSLKKDWAKGLTNAVLRNFLRNQNAIMAKLSDNEPAFFSHPVWLIKLLKENFVDNYAEILQSNNEPGPMTLRVNVQKTTRNDYLNLLTKENIATTISDISNDALVLENAIDVKKLPGFKEGLVSVQDEAAQLAADFLPLKNNLKILDTCAAPGGKSAHLLEKNPSIELTSVDISEKRCQIILENFSRLNLKGLIKVADCTLLNKDYAENYFDSILCDVPCSATGVIRRHPDIKLLRKASDIENLAKQQLGILLNIWSLLKNQGYLLYATCSLLKKENDDVIENFLHKIHDASSVQLKHQSALNTKYGLQFLPKAKSHDGFYYALLQKK